MSEPKFKPGEVGFVVSNPESGRIFGSPSPRSGGKLAERRQFQVILRLAGAISRTCGEFRGTRDDFHRGRHVNFRRGEAIKLQIQVIADLYQGQRWPDQVIASQMALSDSREARSPMSKMASRKIGSPQCQKSRFSSNC